MQNILLNRYENIIMQDPRKLVETLRQLAAMHPTHFWGRYMEEAADAIAALLPPAEAAKPLIRRAILKR